MSHKDKDTVARIKTCVLVLRHVSDDNQQSTLTPKHHAINKTLIINEPQNGSNWFLQHNVSISIPRMFMEQLGLILISVSSLWGEKRH